MRMVQLTGLRAAARRWLASLRRSLAQTTRSSKSTIDNFIFSPERLTVKAGTTVTWTNRDDIPHTVASKDRLFKSKVMDTDESFSFTFTTPGEYAYFCSLHPHMTGTIVVEGDDGEWRFAMMLAGRRRSSRARSAMAGDVHDPERARRFRDAALPHLDEVYTLARYLLRNAADADDAVQECYLRALQHFDTFRGGADQAVAVRHPAQCLPRELCATRLSLRPGRSPRMRCRCGARRRRRRRRICCAAATSNRSATW